MFIQTKIVLITATLLITACGGGGSSSSLSPSPQPVSSDVIYNNISVLGGNVNDAIALDAGPQISPNGLELYFFSDRIGGFGGMDIYRSTRATTADSWGIASNLGAIINSIADERNVTLVSDGLIMYFSSTIMGGEGSEDIYTSSRATLSDVWGAPTNIGNVVNTPFGDGGPSVSGDNLSLYFHSNRTGTIGNNDLYVSTRMAMADPWGVPVNLGSVVNSADFENTPSIASDGLSLYFHTTRAGGPGAIDIWRSTRASVNVGWDAPAALPASVNSTTNDLQPGLSEDWQELYFASDSGGDRDIWVAVP